MQAQDFPGAKWSIGLRVPSATDAAVEAAIADRRIARSWPMRGTLHFVPPHDLRWMLALSAPRLRNSSAKRRSDLGITDEQTVATRRIAETLMADTTVVRRDALLAAFEAAGVSTEGQRGYHLLWQLGHDGVVVFGPPDGKQPTFALFDEWIPRSRDLVGDEALAEFALRYFTSHGPATVQDFAWWSNQTLGDARRGLAAIESHLEHRDWGGDTFWFRPGLEPAPRGTHLLPGFDEFVLGYGDRSAPLNGRDAATIVPGNNGVFLSTIVVGGLIAGKWQRTATAKRVSVGAEWFGAAASIAKPLRRYGEFVGLPASQL
jgi:Winged helix DNA-binding domain